MKTIFAILAFSTLIGTQSMAVADTVDVKTKKIETTENSILSPADALLFESGRLDETLIKPVYTSVEQVIFTEQVRKVQKED